MKQRVRTIDEKACYGCELESSDRARQTQIGPASPGYAKINDNQNLTIK